MSILREVSDTLDGMARLAAAMPERLIPPPLGVGTCPECGAMWDYENERCTGNCQNADKE